MVNVTLATVVDSKYRARSKGKSKSKKIEKEGGEEPCCNSLMGRSLLKKTKELHVGSVRSVYGISGLVE